MNKLLIYIQEEIRYPLNQFIDFIALPVQGFRIMIAFLFDGEGIIICNLDKTINLPNEIIFQSKST